MLNIPTLTIKRLKIKSLFAFVLALLAYGAVAGQTPQMSQQALLAALANSPEKILLIDARSPEEYQQGHIAGALNVSHNKIHESLAQLTPYQHKTVVVYCRSGRRAAMAEQILAENGFNDLRHLSGDMNAWLSENLPLVSND